MGETDQTPPLNEPECREPTVEDLVRLCRALNEARAKYVVVGGFAIRAAGFSRTTLDIDLLVETGPENEARVREFGDAVFHFEFRYTKIEGTKGYHSGAYARNSKDGAIWHQAQFGDADGGFLFGETPGPEGKKKFFMTRQQVTDNRVKPAGEWNTLEITARGKTISLWVNGAVTCRFEDCGQPRGLVGLEGEGYRIEFRNLKVKELN